MRVYNVSDPDIPADAVYVGRGSPWGNRHRINRRKGMRRDRVIALFREDAEARLEREPSWLEPLRGVSGLVCHCAPKPCHGNVLVELLERTA